MIPFASLYLPFVVGPVCWFECARACSAAYDGMMAGLAPPRTLRDRYVVEGNVLRLV